jgi:hypothetical protein
MTFVKGQSGNPAGRPPGSKNRATLFAEALLPGEADMIIRTAIEQAINRDATALRLCLDRLAPRLAPRGNPVALDLPPLKTPADAIAALAEIARALADGEITAGEADDMSRAVTRWLETFQVEARLKKEADAQSGDHRIVFELDPEPAAC